VLTCTLAHGSTCWILARSAGHRCSVLVGSAAHPPQPESAKEKRSSCGSVPCVFKPPLRVLRAKIAGMISIPQTARQQAEKGTASAEDLVKAGVGARPRFVQLASDDSYCGTFPAPANHHATTRPFAFACPRSLDQAQSASTRIYS
jgi:hypothetical protein